MDIIDKAAESLYEDRRKGFEGELKLEPWNELDDPAKDSWKNIVLQVLKFSRETCKLSEREKKQVAHAVDYVDFFSDAGVSGDSSFKLIAKLADALRF